MTSNFINYRKSVADTMRGEAALKTAKPQAEYYKEQTQELKDLRSYKKANLVLSGIGSALGGLGRTMRVFF